MTRCVVSVGFAVLMVIMAWPLHADDSRSEVDFESECLKETSSLICRCMAALIDSASEPEDAQNGKEPEREMVAGIPKDTWVDAFTACVAALP